MSGFDSLLSQLQQTATQVSTSAPPPTSKRRRDQQEDPQETSTPKKPHQDNSDPTTPVDYNDFLPHDHHHLHPNFQIHFLVIGAQKAGTSWLHSCLHHHPQIALPSHTKEVHFWDWHRHKGLRWYASQWDSTTTTADATTVKRGEVTPCYAVLSNAHIAEIRALFGPQLKLIFVARNLVERAWSSLVMELKNSQKGLTAGQFTKQQRREIHGGNTQHNRDSDSEEEEDHDDVKPEEYNDEYYMDRLRHSSHSTRSDYATGLRRWLRHFSKEHVLILNYNDMKEKPKDMLKEVCEFLEVPGSIENTADEGTDGKDGDQKQKDQASEPPNMIPQETKYKDKPTSNQDPSNNFFVPQEELTKRINATTTFHPLKPSLRRQMQRYLEPYRCEFNALLSELGYKWSI